MVPSSLVALQLVVGQKLVSSLANLAIYIFIAVKLINMVNTINLYLVIKQFKGFNYTFMAGFNSKEFTSK